MATLGELAQLIRSKNAGPFVLTFDIMFATDEEFERVRASGVISADAFAKLYGFDRDKVRYFECPNARAFKLSVPRPTFQGELGDSDMHGGQQYAPLVGLEVP